MTAGEADGTGDFYTFPWLLVREVFEESPLHEVPWGGVDYLPSGPRRHGPWDPAHCSEVLVRWLDLGLIELDVRSVGTSHPPPALEPAEAARVLRDFPRWGLEHYPDTHVCPSNLLLRQDDPEKVLHDAAPSL